MEYNRKVGDNSIENKEIELYLRDCTFDDRDIVFEWVNDDVTRNNSFSTDKITYEDHCHWFEKVLSDNNRKLFILMVRFSENDVPIGQARVDINDDCGEISYSLASDYRGYGIGKDLLRLVEKEICYSCPSVTRLVGKVKNGNVASRKSFSDTGYLEKYVQYEKDIFGTEDCVRSLKRTLIRSESSVLNQ